MAKFVMEVNLDNAAFHDDDGDFDPHFELTRVIGIVKCQINELYSHATCFDVNGNKIGTWEVKE